MSETVILGLGAVVALLGGLAIARWGRCLRHPSECPPITPEQRASIIVEGATYSTVVKDLQGNTLTLLAPLHKGLPLSFPPETLGTLEVSMLGGVYTAEIRLTGRGTYQEGERGASVLYAQVQGRWRHLQRRQSQRVQVIEEVPIEAQTGNMSFIGWVRDISAGGVYLTAPVALETGTQIILEIPPSLRAKGVLDEQRKAVVLSCERTLKGWDYLYGLRIAFL